MAAAQTSVEPVAEAEAVETGPVWIAGGYGGVVARDGGPSSPYATLSLTRYQGGGYVSAAFTAYRSTLRQFDAALPSTYYLGSLGAGGNFDDWVVDAHASYGRQDYGLVETTLGKRRSDIGASDYFAAGLRAGRMFRPAPQWYLTPTLSVDYVATKSLRHRIGTDFELPERVWTGAASLRLDRTFGRDQQNDIGLSATHHVSDNGLTQLGFGGPGQGAIALRTPDQWQDAELSGTVRLRQGLWLDGQVQRTFGAVAGDATTVTLGLRLKL